MPHRLFAFVLTVAALAAPFAHADPLGTGFTYQGKLESSGSPVTGTTDFQFTLWDAASGVSQVAGPVAANNVTVTNGLFTVPIDFGAHAFDGDARWLEVAARTPAGSGSFTTLTPRQPLTVAPYALQTRGIFVSSNELVGIGTTTPASPLHLVSDQLTLVRAEGTQTAGNTTTGYFSTASDIGNAIYARSTPSTGSAKGIIADSSSPTGVGVYGRALHATGANFGVHGATSSTSGRGVFGQATAASGTTSGAFGESASTSGRGVFGQATSATGDTYGGRFQSASMSGHGVLGYATAFTGTNYGVWGQSNSPDGFAGYFTGAKSYFEGSVGIGTAAPERALDVVGRVRLRQDTPPSGGNSAGIDFYQQTPAEDRAFIGMRNDDQIGLYGRAGSGWSFVMDVATGNVGIGTTSPQAKLHVAGNTQLDGAVFIAPIRRWLSVHHSAFSPISDNVEFNQFRYLQNLSSGPADFYAPVQLPDGADIISMTAYLIDQLDVDDVSLELTREPMAGDYEARDVICAVSSTGHFPGSRAFADSTPNTAFDRVDNNLYGYSLHAILPLSPYGVRGVVIEYEIDRPLP